MASIITTLIEIIIVLIIAGVIYWAIEQLLPLLPLPGPFMQVIRVLLIVILVLIVLWVIVSLLGLFTNVHLGRLSFGNGLALEAIRALV